LNLIIIIPAYNEEAAIGLVISEIPTYLQAKIIVANNASTDNTKQVATAAGAIVVDENKKGYGAACLKAMTYVATLETKPDVIVFLDGDHSDYPEQMIELLKPIQNNEADFVLGSRSKGNREKGSMTIPQRFGNELSTLLLKWIYGFEFTDLGPFRAIRYSSLLSLNMQDTNYGWTIEMQIKSLQKGLRIREIPVNYRNRIGQSKVSGTVKGVFGAGYKILFTIFKYALKRP